MRHIVLIGLLTLVLTVPFGQAQRIPVMTDPVFGIGYDTSKVHFEVAPSRISRTCAELLQERYWIFAYWRDEETEYFVLSSRTSSLSGAGVVISARKCVVGLPDWILTGNPEYGPRETTDGHSELARSARDVKFTPEILHGLTKDLLRRYSDAFGGKKNFLEAVHRDGLHPDDTMPVLKEEFESYSNEEQR